MFAQKPADARTHYWQRVRRLTAVLLFLWFVMTFGIVFFARELSTFTILGWPFSFYMAGQGLIIFYLIVVAVYMRRMQRIDKLLKNESSDA